MNDPRSQDETTEDAPQDADSADSGPREDGVRESATAAGTSTTAEAGAGEAATTESGEVVKSGDPRNRREPHHGGPEVPAAKAPRRRGVLVLGVLALLVALVAAGATGWLAWRGYRLQQQVQQIPAQRSQAIADLATHSQLGQLEQRLQTLAGQSRDTSKKLQDRLQNLEDAFQQVRDLAVRNQVAWRMAEVHYLLSVAQRRLSIAGDVDSAVAALEGADDSLAALGDVRLLELRKKILSDLTQLRASQPADVEGVALRLQRLLGRIGDLPLARMQASGSASDGGSEKPVSWWQWVKNQVARFVVVHHVPSGTEARTAPQSRGTLPPDDALRLALDDARSAALARDAKRYQQATERALGILQDRFASDAPVTQRFRAALKDVASRAVTRDLPDLTGTIEMADKVAARVRTERSASSADSDSSGDADAATTPGGN